MEGWLLSQFLLVFGPAVVLLLAVGSDDLMQPLDLVFLRGQHFLRLALLQVEGVELGL